MYYNYVLLACVKKVSHTDGRRLLRNLFIKTGYQERQGQAV